MGLSKSLKRYLIIVEAFKIIQERQPIQVGEICSLINDRCNYRVSIRQLGQYLRPLVREGQLLKAHRHDGAYYITGKQAIIPAYKPSKSL